MTQQELLKSGKKMKSHGIAGVVLFFFCFIIVPFILAIIDGVKMLSTKWDNEQLEKDKKAWGIVAIVFGILFPLVGSIASIVFGKKVIAAAETTASKPAAKKAAPAAETCTATECAC